MSKKNKINNRESQFKTSSSTVEKIISLVSGIIVAVILLYYNASLKEPKLSGSISLILDVLNMTFTHPGIPKDQFTVFLTISNERNIPVPVINYILEAKYEDGTSEFYHPMYRDRSKFIVIRLFSSHTQLILPKEDQYLLNQLKTLVTKEHPLTGFIHFAGWKENKKAIKNYTLHLLDGYGNSHTVDYETPLINDISAITYLIKGSELKEMK